MLSSQFAACKCWIRHQKKCILQTDSVRHSARKLSHEALTSLTIHHRSKHFQEITCKHPGKRNNRWKEKKSIPKHANLEDPLLAVCQTSSRRQTWSWLVGMGEMQRYSEPRKTLTNSVEALTLSNATPFWTTIILQSLFYYSEIKVIDNVTYLDT